QVAAYKDEHYVKQLVDYVHKNMLRLEEFTREEDLGLCFKCPQGTYLAWIDSSQSNMTGDELQNRLVNYGRVGIMPGSTYGDQKCLRMNLACPRSKLEEGLKRIKLALEK
ncbi:aminotransferase class I/II-fold pyridoxal phosphate-dependent enzyme, partial [Liquorilactobacillus satsumensis]